MDRVTVGIIGAGMIGKSHARALSDIREAEVKVVADVREDFARETATAAGAKEVVADYRKVLEDPAIDAVVICTPPFLHHPMTMEAVAAGKHVLCEKPFAHSPEAADEMVAAADEAGVVLADCSARHARLTPTYRTVKAMIDGGKLGDVYLIRHFGRGRRGRGGLEYHPAAKWFLDRSKAVGGIAIDWGVYDLSMIWGLLGDEVECVDALGFAVQGIDEVETGEYVYDVEEHGGGALKLSNGVVILWDRANACHMDSGSSTRIMGTRGGLKFDAWNRQLSTMTYYTDILPGTPMDMEVPIKGQKEHGSDHPHIDRDFIEALRTGRAPAMPGRVAARVLRAIVMIYQSAGVWPAD